jgi:exopolysaccharide transport family protein
MQREEAHLDGDGGGLLSLERAVSAVRRRLHLVGLVTGLIVGITIAIVLMLPNRYDGVAVIQIDPRKKSIANVEGVIADLRADAATVDSEVEVLSSRAVALKVIDVLKLREDPEFRKPAPFTRLLEMFQLGQLLPSKPSEADTLTGRRLDTDPIGSLIGTTEPGTYVPERDEVAAAFEDRLRVGRVRSTLLIEIRFSSEDPVKAARIANTIAEVYLDDQLSGKKHAAGFATRLLEEKISELKDRVSEAERKVAQFKSDNSIFDSEGHILSEKELARIMEQAVLARNATAEAKARLELGERLQAAPDGTATISGVLGSDTVRVLREQVALVQRRLAEVETRYGPLHPELQKARADAQEARSQLLAEIARLVANLRNEFEIAQRREMQLIQTLTTLKEKESGTKEASVRLAELEREAATSRQLLEAMLVRYKQTSEIQDLQLPDARIIEQADVPLYPAGPKRKQWVLVAFIGGLLFSVGLAIALELATPGVSRPEDVERALEVAHIGSLPLLVAHPGHSNRLGVIRSVLADPRGVYAEAVRGVRHEIDIRRPPSRSRVILIASALPGEGADALASNLAHHYAMTGERVLLLDGDTRRAPLTRSLAPERRFGLLDILQHRAPLEQAVLRDSASGLHFLPAFGPSPVEQARPELLGSEHMVEVLADLKRQFDTIIIDSPPLLPVVDARILANFADQIVFVMTWRKTPKQLAKRALATLGRNHDKIAGVVVVSVAPEALEDGYAMSAHMSRHADLRTRMPRAA